MRERERLGGHHRKMVWRRKYRQAREEHPETEWQRLQSRGRGFDKRKEHAHAKSNRTVPLRHTRRRDGQPNIRESFTSCFLETQVNCGTELSD